MALRLSEPIRDALAGRYGVPLAVAAATARANLYEAASFGLFALAILVFSVDIGPAALIVWFGFTLLMALARLAGTLRQINDTPKTWFVQASQLEIGTDSAPAATWLVTIPEIDAMFYADSPQAAVTESMRVITAAVEDNPPKSGIKLAFTIA